VAFGWVVDVIESEACVVRMADWCVPWTSVSWGCGVGGMVGVCECMD
jgi:hypothetical protein